MWKATLSGELEGIATAILDGISGTPDELMLNYETVAKVPADWRRQLCTATKGWLVRWSDTGWLVSRDRYVVTIHVPEPAAVRTAMTVLAGLPFELAAFASLHAWVDENGEPYLAPTFSDGHFRHGWACAFRGRGHDRLVSSRWLDHGPWVVERGIDGMSFVVFHDPNADAPTALAQASPGHLRMGISEQGGFIQSNYVYEHDLKGFFLPAKRLMRILVSRRDVSQREMRDARAARLYQRWDEQVDSVAFAFLEEERARQHLEMLWLHGLQCLAVSEGDELRLDADYEATATPPPAWTAQLRS